MPELPEVETIRRQLEPRLVGRSIVAAWGHPSPKFSEAPEAIGGRVVSVDRRGKYLLLNLDRPAPTSGRAISELVLHLGMTGVLAVVPSPSTDPYIRARWLLDDGSVFEFRDVRRFGRLAVIPDGDYRRLPTLHALGPEPLSDEFTADGLWRSLSEGRARVKTRLLGQRVVAGVGNIYADEALWSAGIDPGARRVGREAAGRLWVALREVLQQGVDHGGTTLRDYRDADGGMGSNQHLLHCYGRTGRPCERCGTPLERRVVDQRGTTWCPACQGRRRAGERRTTG